MCKEQKVRDETKSSGVTACCSLRAVTSSVIYYSTKHMDKRNLFVLYNKNSNGLLKDIWGMHEKRKTTLLT